ncbi:MAG: hypothetical protein ACOY46_20640 [Bacillota bacterium]
MTDYLNNIPIIALSDYQQPMFQLTTIKYNKGRYELVNIRGLGVISAESSPFLCILSLDGKWSKVANKDYVEGIWRYKHKDFFKAEYSIQEKIWAQQYIKLDALDRNFHNKAEHRKIIEDIRCKHGIPELANLKYHRSVAGENNILFIDRYLDQQESFKNDILQYCTGTLAISEESRDKYLVAAYVLLGKLIVDRESQVSGFIANLIWEALNSLGESKCPSSCGKVVDYQLESETNIDPMANFMRILKKLVSESVLKDKDAFMKKIEKLQDYHSIIPGEISLFLFPKIHIIHIINEKGTVLRRFFEVIPELTRDIFYMDLVSAINVDEADLSYKSDTEMKAGYSESLFPRCAQDLKEILSGKAFCQMPLCRTGVHDFRKLYPLLSQAIKRESWRTWTKEYNPEHLITIILKNGMFGIPAMGTSAVAEVIDADVLNPSISRLAKRAEREKVFVFDGENKFKLF